MTPILLLKEERIQDLQDGGEAARGRSARRPVQNIGSYPGGTLWPPMFETCLVQHAQSMG